MKIGYYYANSRQYGKGWKEVRGYCRIYADWEYGLPLPPGLIGVKLWVDLNLADDFADHMLVDDYLKALTPQIVKGKVAAIQLKDEPRWNRRELDKAAAYVKAEMKRLKLPPVPIGATFHYDQIMGSDSWKAINLDWIGPEFYLKKQAGDNANNVALRMSDVCRALMGRIGRTRKVIPTIMAYDQRKTTNPATRTWNEAELIRMQEPAFKAVHDLGTQALFVLLFSYRRPGGTSEYPALKAEHKRLLKVYA